MSGRRVAVEAVTRVLGDGRSLSAALESAQAPAEGRERALARELAFGVFRWLPRLELILDQLTSKPLKRKDVDVQAVLLLGLYQLMATRIPPHAAVAESVELTRTLGKGWAGGLVNAVLRRFEREREAILEAVRRHPAGAVAHPGWLIEAIRHAWPDDWQRILAAGNERPPMTLRVNAARCTRRAYLERLAAAGIGAGAAPFTAAGVRLEAAMDVTGLPGFADGDVSVQDAAAQLAAPLLDLAPGARVLDACAAPGGKTAHMLELEPALAALVAVDEDARRLDALRRGLERLRFDCLAIRGDATHPQQWWDGVPFDRILLDAPCTATGVIRRHPDIKFHRREDDVARLVSIQRALLEALWPLLAHGGLLLYATCSILPQENQQQVAEFVNSRSDAVSPPIESGWGRPVEHGRQILPGEHGMDGFYYALLAKR